jgi:hypothetical protein
MRLIRRLRDIVCKAFEPSRELSLALTKLDECEMWLTRAKLRYGEAPEQDANGRDFG